MSQYTDPADRLRAITPNDATDVTGLRGIYVGGDGNLALMAIGDTAAVTLTGVLAGTIIPVRAKYVMATNTTATALVGLY